MRPIAQTLQELGLRNFDVEYSVSYGDDWKSWWNESVDGGCLLWFCERLKIDRRWVMMAAVWCAIPMLQHLPAMDRKGHHDLLWLAVRCCRGEVSRDELVAVADGVVRYATTFVAYYPPSVPDHVADYFVDCHPDVLTRRASLAHSANYIRQVIPWSMIEEKLKELP